MFIKTLLFIYLLLVNVSLLNAFSKTKQVKYTDNWAKGARYKSVVSNLTSKYCF